jgi:hypothetical protein
MNNKIKMKNILIYSVVLGIAVLRQAVEMPDKNPQNKKRK